MQGWGTVQLDEWRAQGLTDRLMMPQSELAPCWEDLTAAYDWGGGVSSPLASALSSSDCLPRACGKDGAMLPALATLLPEPAADVPLVAPPKKVPVGMPSKRSSSKGSRGSRKAGGRTNAKARPSSWQLCLRAQRSGAAILCMYGSARPCAVLGGHCHVTRWMLCACVCEGECACMMFTHD